MNEIDSKYIFFFTLLFFTGLYFTTQPYIIDDAYITLRCAQNWLNGNGLYFNKGQDVYTITNPLWAFLVALVSKLGLTLKASMLAIAAAFMYCNYFLLYIWLKTYFPQLIALCAASIFMTHPVLLGIGMSGMETPFYLTLIIAIILLAERKRYVLSWILCGISIFVRPDAIVIGLVLGLWQMAESGIVKSIKYSLILLAFVLLYLLFGYLNYDTIIPNSVITKAGSGSFFSEKYFHNIFITSIRLLKTVMGNTSFQFMPNPHFIILPLVLYTFSTRTFKLNRIIGFSIAISLFMLILSRKEINYNWYYIPPMLAVPYFIAQYLKTSRLSNQKLIGFAVIFVLASVFYNYKFNNHLRKTYSYSNRELTYEAISKWANGWMAEGDKLASSEIGALGYYIEPEIEVLDLYGLSRRREDRNISRVTYLRKYSPACIVARHGRIDLIENSNAFYRQYKWYNFNGKAVGLNKQIVGRTGNNWQELNRIYDELKSQKGL